jgi:hypothetical protein
MRNAIFGRGVTPCIFCYQEEGACGFKRAPGSEDPALGQALDNQLDMFFNQKEEK